MSECVETLNHWGEGFSVFAWSMLWQSSLLIAVIFIIDLIFARRIRSSVRYALWMVVLVKLVLPPALALPTSATWWLWRPHSTVETRAIRNYTVSFGNNLPGVLPLATAPVVELVPKLNGDAWALLAVAAMGAGLLSWLAFRWMRVAAKVQGAATAPAELDGILEEVRKLAGLRRPLRLKLIDDKHSPAVYGLFRPVILLPRTLANQLGARQLRAVLLHEAMHLRRGDVWINFAQTLLQIAYWWHPLLWLANIRIRRVREEAVDDAVMHALRNEADAYAPTLLEVAKFAFRRPLASLGLIGILESRSALRQRVERLVNYRAPRRAGTTLLSLLGVFAFAAVALPMGQGPEKASSTRSTGSETSAPVDTNGLPANITITRETASHGSTNVLVMRTFKIGTNDFFTNLRGITGSQISASDTNVSAFLKQYFEQGGVDLSPPRKVFFNQRIGGILFVYGSPRDLDVVESAIISTSRTSTRDDERRSFESISSRKAIARKLNSIHLDEVSYPDLPLSEVIRQLTEITRALDQHKQGIHFQFNPSDPDLPIQADAGSAAADPSQININLNLKNVSLEDALNAICLASVPPVKYSIEDDGIVFSPKSTNSRPIFHVRAYQIDGETFLPPEKLSGTLTNYTGAVGFPEIQLETGKLQDVYRQAGYTNVRVVCPMQRLTNGIVHLKVVIVGSKGEIIRTPKSRDVIGKAMQNSSGDPPMIQIKTRFIEVPENIFSSVAANSLPPGMADGGILTAAESKKILQLLESQNGSEELAEPEATTMSGFKLEMRAVAYPAHSNYYDWPDVPKAVPGSDIP